MESTTKIQEAIGLYELGLLPEPELMLLHFEHQVFTPEFRRQCWAKGLKHWTLEHDERAQKWADINKKIYEFSLTAVRSIPITVNLNNTDEISFEAGETQELVRHEPGTRVWCIKVRFRANGLELSNHTLWAKFDNLHQVQELPTIHETLLQNPSFEVPRWLID